MAHGVIYCVTVRQVPFVDVMATMSDPSIPLTVEEYEVCGGLWCFVLPVIMPDVGA